MDLSLYENKIGGKNGVWWTTLSEILKYVKDEGSNSITHLGSRSNLLSGCLKYLYTITACLSPFAFFFFFWKARNCFLFYIDKYSIRRRSHPLTVWKLIEIRWQISVYFLYIFNRGLRLISFFFSPEQEFNHSVCFLLN